MGQPPGFAQTPELRGAERFIRFVRRERLQHTSDRAARVGDFAVAKAIRGDLRRCGFSQFAYRTGA